jgi:hypothetical protein
MTEEVPPFNLVEVPKNINIIGLVPFFIPDSICRLQAPLGLVRGGHGQYIAPWLSVAVTGREPTGKYRFKE